MERIKFSATTAAKLNARYMRGWSKSLRKGDLFAARARGIQKGLLWNEGIIPRRHWH